MVFEAYDVDGSGALSEAEQRLWSSDLGANASASEALAALQNPSDGL